MTWVLEVEVAVVFVAGCVGGAVTGGIAHARNKNNDNRDPCREPKKSKGGLVYTNTQCNTIYAGTLGNILLGGLAAVVYWCLYGPISGFPVLGTPPSEGPFLTVGQLAGSILLGIGGPGFLLAEAERRCCERTRANNQGNQVTY